MLAYIISFVRKIVFRITNLNIVLLMSSLNRAGRYKGTQQSQFRVHFYLRNIPYDPNCKPDAFIQNIVKQMTVFCQVGIMQICSSIKSQVDISVALTNDNFACQLIESKKKICLSVGQNDDLLQIQPRIGDAFRSYYLNWQNKIRIRNQGEDRDPKKQSKYSEDFSDNRKKYRTNNNDQYKRRQMEYSSRSKYLWIFCIPLQFKQRQICTILSQQNISVKSYNWRCRQDMQFLQVELLEPIQLKQIDSLDIKIDKYPLLVMTRQQLSLHQVLMDYQVELNFDKDIDEFELIRFVNASEGVLCMIKDQFYGARKYVVALNTMSKANRITDQAQKQFKYCHIGKPRYIVRLGRLQKSFTFAQTIEHLQMYKQQYEIRRQII